jgi:hypothetical protein
MKDLHYMGTSPKRSRPPPRATTGLRIGLIYAPLGPYIGTSLVRNSLPLAPYRGTSLT